METTLKQPKSVYKSKDYILSISIIGILFFIFGFVTWLNGTLIPYLKIACELNNFEAYFVAFAFYISYFVMALPSSWVLKKTGFKNGMALGLVVMALGTLVFIPAAYTRTYSLFLTGLFIQGTGLAILQTASNPYITIIGPIESAAKRISMMGICNKVAGVISPLILGVILLKNADVIKEQLLTTTDIVQKSLLLDEMAARVMIPYVVMAIVLIILAAMIRYAPLPDIDTDKEANHVNEANGNKTNIFQFPHLILGFIAIFVYVGVEVIAGDTIILYGQSQGIPLSGARLFTSYTLIGMLIGYILGIILIPKIVNQSRFLSISAIAGILFSVTAILTAKMGIRFDLTIDFAGIHQILPLELSVFFIALLGIANAIMWPAIWPLAIEGLGKFTKTGSAILIMGIAGGATLPLLYGKLVDVFNAHQAYWIMVPCYIFIFYYAIKGHKIRRKV
ncbi:MAG: glucose/galactose MFS transporter [Bacteroidetes bacterium CG2_30_32_10]|nr:MAG: glucose/galactose MFS transporter [Bacteroidetes bacterium CG2_30_32_10]